MDSTGEPSYIQEKSARRRYKNPGRRLTEGCLRTSVSIEYSGSTCPSRIERAASVASSVIYCFSSKHSSTENRQELHAPATLMTAEQHSLSVDNEKRNALGGLNSSFKQSTESDNKCPSSIYTVSDCDRSPPKKKCKISSKCNFTEKNNSGINFHLKVFNFFLVLFKLIYRLLCIMITISLLMGVVSFAVIWLKNRCEEQQESKYDLINLKGLFSKHIIGQDMGFSQILSVLDKFHNDEYSEPHVLWTVGWTGTGKSRAMDIITHALEKQCQVHYFLPIFFPSSEEAVQGFVNEAVANMNPCRKDIIIVDGWDLPKDDIVVRFLSGLIGKVRVLSQEDKRMNQLLVIIVGVRGSKAINSKYISQRISGVDREELAIETFVNIVKGTDDFDMINKLGPLTIAPFLPLELHHVIECTKNELLHVRKLVNMGLMVLKSDTSLIREDDSAVVARVVNKMSFVPPDNPLLAASGCKGILSILRLELMDVDGLQTQD